MAQPEEPATGRLQYDGTAASRVAITNWMNYNYQDPAPDGNWTIEIATGTWLAQPGDVIVRFPDGTFGIEVQGGEPE